MKKIHLIALLMGALLISNCTKKTEPETISLFNGTDFTGWKMVVEDTTVDVNDVWSVKDGAIHCAGVPNGYIMTEKSYADYRLQLEWRWVDEPTNSGVLVHCQEEAIEGIFWPNCLECQLQAGNAGDFVLIGPGKITVDDSTYVNPERFTVVPKKHPSNEKPVGEWNSYIIETRGNSVSCFVNGLMQNNGIDCAFSSGHIALQSEGSPIEFRNIQLTPLN